MDVLDKETNTSEAILVEVVQNPQTGQWEFVMSTAPLKHTFKPSSSPDGILDQVRKVTGNDTVMYFSPSKDHTLG